MGRRVRWNDLGAGGRAAVVLTAIAQFGLLGAAWVDLARRAPSEVNGPRWLWALASLVNFAGPIAYFARGRATPRAGTRPRRSRSR
ncbi:PLDc N-terminal domain-containing protein [Pseudonocardia sp. C8]|uniref:PLDc N-terminal domain-containing protein n=1 Tax=Pseudonocardia sp. C8 TaxID=2762759 RepID=UPI0016427897|nr:PLDc N-terminal domain-containing protein [Pseudonocardia sp. C8]MBC3192246.1 PLDc N-terminal domain-containing protein [Pseudonocardia sp. C8]